MSNQFVPQWAKGIVWYQIFPERFWNGDRSNDPRIEDQRNAWPMNQTAPFQIHPWTAEWYKRQPYEQENGLDMWQTLHRRRYGGDIQGVIDRLDYLQDLGVEGIYLNPVFEAPSEHKYDGSTFHHIDPNFGPDPDGDRALITAETPYDPTTWVWTSADLLMLDLIAQVHSRGMRIIFDGVFNHMGLNSWAFQSLEKEQQDSPVADWFKVESWRNDEAGIPFKYVGWFGFDTLPEIRQDENGLVGGPRNYVFAATERWLAPNGDVSAGIDGWRLDVAFCIAHPFWRDWRRHVRSLNPEAYLVAEINRPIEQCQPYLQGDQFDAVMNYNFAWAVSEWLVETGRLITTQAFDQKLHALIESYPDGVAYVQQNLFDSHDTARMGSHLVVGSGYHYRNWDEYHRKNQVQNNPDLALRAPNEIERKRQRLVILLQMTCVGAPMIYFGTEAGMWGQKDPDCRQPMVWPEMKYEDQTVGPDQLPLESPQLIQFDHNLFNYYKQLITIRNAYPALKTGRFQTVCVEEHLYGFLRMKDSERILVLINRAENSTEVILNESLFGDRPLRDLMNGREVNSSQPIEVAGMTGMIVVEAKVTVQQVSHFSLPFTIHRLPILNGKW